jgi:hypothetical protein
LNERVGFAVLTGPDTEDLAVPDLFSSLAIEMVLFPPVLMPAVLSSVPGSGLRATVPGEFGSNGFPPLPGDDLESSGSTTGDTEEPRL